MRLDLVIYYLNRVQPLPFLEELKSLLQWSKGFNCNLSPLVPYSSNWPFLFLLFLFLTFCLSCSLFHWLSVSFFFVLSFSSLKCYSPVVQFQVWPFFQNFRSYSTVVVIHKSRIKLQRHLNINGSSVAMFTNTPLLIT